MIRLCLFTLYSDSLSFIRLGLGGREGAWMTTGVRSGVFTGVPRRDNYDGWSGRDRARAVEGKEG